MLLGHLDGQTLFVPGRLGASEQLEAIGDLHVPVQVLALDALEHEATARARREERVRLER
jgi:hypothetical protein